MNSFHTATLSVTILKPKHMFTVDNINKST